jgi:hypothetical protein
VVRRTRVPSDGREVVLPTWRAAQSEDWLGRWAMNLMLINVSTRKLGRAVRLPEAIFRRLLVTAPQSRRPRAALLRCQRNAWQPEWPRTCRNSTSW